MGTLLHSCAEVCEPIELSLGVVSGVGGGSPHMPRGKGSFGVCHLHCFGGMNRHFQGTRRNIHPLTAIMVINHPLSASSIYYDPWHPPCSIRMPYSLFHNLSPSFLWSTSWPGTLHFILHTFLHLIIVFFLQHMPAPLL